MSQESRRIFVLTGGPCSGKTTLLAELAGRGYPTIREAAAAIILEGVLHPAKDPAAFQREVLRRQILAETSAAEPGPAFADRGVGDHFGYLEHFRAFHGTDLSPSGFPRELEAAWQEARGRYAAVFILEQSPQFIMEPYRRETQAEARAIHEAIASAYKARHPRVFEVPWGPVEPRLKRVLYCAHHEEPFREE